MVARTVSRTLDPDGNAHPVRFCVEYCKSDPSLHLTFRDLEVDREDILPLRAAFESCSPDELLAAILRHEAGWSMRADALESHARAMLVRKVTDALDEMVEEPLAAPSVEQKRVVGPLWRFVADGVDGRFALSAGAAVFAVDGCGAVRELLGAGLGRVRTWDELRKMRRIAGSCKALGKIAIPVFEGSIARLSRMSWDEALTLSIWLPKGLSDRERYAVLARSFWAMTYRGFSREEQERSRRGEREGGRVADRCRMAALWPDDPVRSVLAHNCWVDALEMHEALFAMLPSSGNMPVTEGEAH